MEITEGHVKIAKREFLKEESIPVVAGKMMNHVGPDAEFSDLIAIANQGKKAATEPSYVEESETSGEKTVEDPDSDSNEVLSESMDVDSQRKALAFDNESNTESSEPDPSEIKTTVKRNNNAQDSWEA